MRNEAVNNVSALLNSLDGGQIPGGCDTCDAYQTIRSAGHPAVAMLTVHHDEWCPTYLAMQEK